MRTKSCYLLLTLLMVSFAIAGTYSGGMGTEGDPYIISTKADLKELSETDADWTSFFLQSADISFAATDFQSGGDFYNGGMGFLPIGHLSPYFSGVYNGNNHVISGLIINRSSERYNGLFGYIRLGAISNLDVIDFRYESFNQCGGLVGQIYKTDISNCSSDGDIISTEDYIGGLIGNISDSCSIIYCHTSGSVSGAYYIGGLIGALSEGSVVSKCYSGVDVTGTSHYCGGLIGISYTNVDNSFSYGTVDGHYWVGGIVGCNQNDGMVTNCYSLCVTTGDLYSWTGGICGINNGTINDCFWDTEVSGLTYSAGGTGKTTLEMKTLSTYTDAGWDFVDESVNGNDDIWDMSPAISNGYPFLPHQDPPDIVCPIVLDYFEGHLNENVIELRWRTASETENQGFIIEKRLQGENDWEAIATYMNDAALQGNGTTSESHEYSYCDNNILRGENHEYRLSDVDYDGKICQRETATVLAACGLEKACPNPFNPSTLLNYALPNASDVTVAVYDMNGRFIETLVNDFQEKGSHEVTWHPKGLGSGVYMIQLQAGDLYDVKKIVYMK